MLGDKLIIKYLILTDVAAEVLAAEVLAEILTRHQLRSINIRVATVFEFFMICYSCG